MLRTIAVVIATLALPWQEQLAQARSVSAAALIRTEQGWVQGLTAAHVEQFLGVPYAAPPLGALRWRPPRPPPPHARVLDAKAFQAPCVQILVTGGMARPPMQGLPPPSENCLYLNIYRPAGDPAGERTPVLVFFHGGGFTGGTGASYDGTPLVEASGIIVVTVNYRLGPLGWLALPALDRETRDHASSGNYGLLDMVAALQWVHQNIGAFGGNPRNVTIAGQSAGGIATCLLGTAPLKQRLFHKVIIESGPCTDVSRFVATHAQAMARGSAFATDLGCTDPATTSTCLRAASVPTLVAATSARLGEYAPNIGGALIPAAPLQAIKSGKFVHGPALLGANHDEWLFSVLPVTGFPATPQSYRMYLDKSFGVLSSRVEMLYPPGAYADPAYAAGAASSDSGFPLGVGVCPMLFELGDAMSKFTTTYAYEFDDPSGGAIFPVPAGVQVGSQHGAELRFLYDRKEVMPQTRTPEEQQMAERMLRYWGNFVRSGNPDGEGSIHWPAYDRQTQRVLRIQPTLDAVLSPQQISEHHCAFWAKTGF